MSMATKLATTVTYLDGFLHIMSPGLAISSDKLKPLYLHYQNFCGYHTGQGGNLQWGVFAHEII